MPSSANLKLMKYQNNQVHCCSHLLKDERTMNMPSSEYNEFRRIALDWRDSREALQRLHDEIARKYDDGSELLRRVDSLHQTRFSDMNLR